VKRVSSRMKNANEIVERNMRSRARSRS